jgi:pimeloyl-ACP methyl ester carboxylesterase
LEPTDLEEPPFPVHLFQVDEDGLVPMQLQRHICRWLGWVNYHELPGVGHFLSAVQGLRDRIISTLRIEIRFKQLLIVYFQMNVSYSSLQYL